MNPELVAEIREAVWSKEKKEEESAAAAKWKATAGIEARRVALGRVFRAARVSFVALEFALDGEGDVRVTLAEDDEADGAVVAIRVAGHQLRLEKDMERGALLVAADNVVSALRLDGTRLLRQDGRAVENERDFFAELVRDLVKREPKAA